MTIPNPVFFYQLFFYFSRPQVRKFIRQIEKETTKWSFLKVKTHPFGGREFNLNDREVAHIHWNGDLDILFKRELVRELIRQKIAGRHRFVPGKAVTLKLRSVKDVPAAITIIRLSYLIHTQKATKDDPKMLTATEKEIKELPYNRDILDLIN
ncbi:MAG: hypothetical protein JWM28_4419 [Chitinophagaceae bacterium]|nr:hypothetical protein [Chitinophagaceae bacterium]